MLRQYKWGYPTGRLYHEPIPGDLSQLTRFDLGGGIETTPVDYRQVEGSGKFYFPVFLSNIDAATVDDRQAVGWVPANATFSQQIGFIAQSVAFYTELGSFKSATNQDPNAIPPRGEWFTCAIDLDTNTAAIFDNAGVQIGNAITGLATGEVWLPGVTFRNAGDPTWAGVEYIEVDVGGTKSDATPPAGYTLLTASALEIDDTGQHQSQQEDVLRGRNYPDWTTAPINRQYAEPPQSDVNIGRRFGGRTFRGAGVIEGTVKTLGSPSIDRVLLIDRVTGIRVGEVRSAADGRYRFPGLEDREYVLLGLDRERQYEAVGRDLARPEFPE